jgi:hypothetical protein
MRNALIGIISNKQISPIHPNRRLTLPLMPLSAITCQQIEIVHLAYASRCGRFLPATGLPITTDKNNTIFL